MIPRKMPFENIVGQRENAEKSAFSLCPTMFSTIPKTNFAILATLKLLSVNALNLDS